MAEPPGIAHARAADPDLLARVGERDPAEAAGLLLEQLVPGVAAHADCVDRLAATLAEPGAPSIGDWARIAGTRRETVFRRFRAAFGVSPTRYRLERRALGAWREIVRTAAPLAEIAARLGFADQAHMTRAVRALTGAPPSAWRGRLRAQPAFKTPPTRPA
jgi:AraC-like DNA-binding protein